MNLSRTFLPSVLLLTFLTAAPAANKPVDDNFIADSVQVKLAGDTVVKGGAIKVDVKDGVVTLTGNVEEEKQKAKAEKIAKKVNGVKSVTNELKIVRPGTQVQ